MPIGINSPARNLFLLGSSGSQVVTNFFKQIDQASSGDFFHTPSKIRYSETDETYILAGEADKTSPASEKYGWIEKRQENGTQDWEVQVSSLVGDNTSLQALELHGSNLVAVGKTGSIPWIAKYTDGGVLDWQSTTNSGDVEYTGVAVDSIGNYYACGNTPSLLPGAEAQAFVEKYDSSGNPGWGKSAIMLGRDVVLSDIAANSRDEVVAVGYLEDDSADKGYIVKIDSATGDVMWDRTLELSSISSPTPGDPVDIKITATAIDNTDHIYVVGNIDPAPPFGSGTTPHEAFIVKYSPEGNILWQSMTDKDAGTMNGIYYNDVVVDNTTKKATVIGRVDYQNVSGPNGVLLTRFDPDGALSWRRELKEDTFNFRAANASGDGDQSFIYLLFNDDNDSETYVYGKVSATGNGLGDFEYDDGTGTPLLDYITTSGPNGSGIGEKIGRLSDGSVRNDTSDLMTYPFTANKLLFDDLATQVSNKKRQMDSADSFEYSGSPAIRPTDFQEMNLLGDIGTTEETIITPSTDENENFASVTSSYSSYGTVAENTVTNDLPFTATHYEGKVRDLQTGGFRVDLTGNTTGSEFIMGCWVKFDTYTAGRQMGIDLQSGFVYWETRDNGVIRIRHTGGISSDSSATNLNDGNWHHIALVRSLGTLRGYVDGQQVVSTTSGVGGLSVNSNEQFWFFGGNAGFYNIDAKILDPFVYVGYSFSGSYTVPTAPLIDANGNINHLDSNLAGFEEYISPGISIAGESTPGSWTDQSGKGNSGTVNGATLNAAGYWEFDGVDDNINLPKTTALANWYAGPYSIEMWFRADNLNLNSNNKGPLIGLSDVDSNGEWWSLGWDNGSVFNFYYWNGSQQNVTGSTTVSTATWYHAVFTHDSGTITLYLNGSQDVTASVIGTPLFDLGSQFDLTVGASANGYHDGQIGEVRIYPRALTAAQVFQNYNSTKSKYINEAPDTAPKITSDGIVIDSNLLLNYDFGNRACFDFKHNYINYNTKQLPITGVYDTNSSNIDGYVVSRGGIVSNTEVAPDGSRTAVLFKEADGFTGSARIFTAGWRQPDFDGQVHYFSTYVKKAESRYVYVGMYQSDDGNDYDGVKFDFDTETLIDADPASNWDRGFTNVGNGWYRIWIGFPINTGVSIYVTVGSDDNGLPEGLTTTLVTRNIDAFYTWGWQVTKDVLTDTYISSGTVYSGGKLNPPTTVKNLSSGSYTGTITDATFNSAGHFEFDGDGTTTFDAIDIPAWTNKEVKTVELWFYNFNAIPNDESAIGGPTTYQSLLNWGDGPAGITLGAWTSSATNESIGVWSYTTSGRITYLDVAVASGIHHLVVTWNTTDSHYYIYLDNVRQTEIAGSGGHAQLLTYTDAMTIGGNTGSGATPYYFNGNIYEFRVYDRELTATEVSQNFNATRGKYGV